MVRWQKAGTDIGGAIGGRPAGARPSLSPPLPAPAPTDSHRSAAWPRGKMPREAGPKAMARQAVRKSCENCARRQVKVRANSSPPKPHREPPPVASTAADPFPTPHIALLSLSCSVCRANCCRSASASHANGGLSHSKDIDPFPIMLTLWDANFFSSAFSNPVVRNNACVASTWSSRNRGPKLQERTTLLTLRAPQRRCRGPRSGTAKRSTPPPPPPFPARDRLRPILLNIRALALRGHQNWTFFSQCRCPPGLRPRRLQAVTTCTRRFTHLRPGLAVRSILEEQALQICC